MIDTESEPGSWQRELDYMLWREWTDTFVTPQGCRVTITHKNGEHIVLESGKAGESCENNS